MTGGVSRGKTLERTCPYENRIPVSNARRDPMWMADDHVSICNIHGHTCVLEDGHQCPEFDVYMAEMAIADAHDAVTEVEREIDLWDLADQKWKADHENEE